MAGPLLKQRGASPGGEDGYRLPHSATSTLALLPLRARGDNAAEVKETASDGSASLYSSAWSY